MKGIQTLLVTSALAVGCKSPPEAPTELEELCGYIFAHLGDGVTEDGDAAELVAGIDNLDAWLDVNLDETFDGFAIDNLDEDAVDALDGRDRSTDGLLGAVVATESDYSVEDVVEVLILLDQDEVATGEYKVYERTFDGDPECFASQECDWLEAEVYTETSFAEIITVRSTATAQYRWADVPAGMSMPMRTWMVEPADVSWDSIKVESHYFLSVMLPSGNGSIRLQATWIDANYTSGQETEDYARTQMVNSMRDMSDQIEEYLDAH